MAARLLCAALSALSLSETWETGQNIVLIVATETFFKCLEGITFLTLNPELLSASEFKFSICCGPVGNVIWSRSSQERELQFVLC